MAVVVEYRQTNSPVHNLNPLTKMAWALAVLVFSIMFNDYRFLAGVLTSVLAVALLGEVTLPILKLYKGLLIFALILFIIQVTFYDEGRYLFPLIPLGQGYLRVTDVGIYLGISTALRMLTIVTSFLVFLATTRTQDILNALVEKAKVPYDIAFMILTSIRFIPTFLTDLKQISDAQKARGFVLEGWNPVKKIKAYLPLAVPLVLMSLRKAQQMVLSMETRGYGVGQRSHLRELHVSYRDFIALALIITMLAVGVYLRLNGFGTFR